MTEMMRRSERWSKDHPILFAAAGSVLMFLLVFGVLWGFVPRVSTDDALRTAVMLAAIYGPMSYASLKSLRKRS